MTSTFFWGAITTLWLGILATISPCPLATNIAAVSMITGGGGKTPQNAFITAASYGLGRMVTHGFLGILILRISLCAITSCQTASRPCSPGRPLLHHRGNYSPGVAGGQTPRRPEEKNTGQTPLRASGHLRRRLCVLPHSLSGNGGSFFWRNDPLGGTRKLPCLIPRTLWCGNSAPRDGHWNHAFSRSEPTGKSAR